MINEGIASELESTNKVNVSSIVAKLGLSLSQKYGYDKILVEGIIYSLAIGCGNITYSDYNTLFVPPIQNQPAPNQPQNNQNQQTTQNSIATKYVYLLLLGYIALFFSPAIYLELTHHAHWWPIIAITPIAFIHFASISMVGVEIANDCKNRPMPLVVGLYMGLAICAILFWIFCPIVFGFDFIDLNKILDYYGFSRKAESPTILSIFLSWSYAFCCFLFVPGAIEASGITIPANSKFSDNCKIMFGNKSFRKGFLFSCIFFIMVGFIGFIMPSLI